MKAFGYFTLLFPTFCSGLDKLNESGQNENYDWQSSYPKWWWWYSSHHNDHNHETLDLNNGNNEESITDPQFHFNQPPSDNIDGNGEALKNSNVMCRNGKHVGGNNGGKENSCFYCWRNFSEGAKKPTYKELFEFESSRQGILRSKMISHRHSIHYSTPNLNKNEKGTFIAINVLSILQ